MIIENLSIQESERIKMAQQVFKKHQVDSSVFNETRRRHAENERYWIKIYTKIREGIQAKMDSIRSAQNLPEAAPSKPE